MAREIVASFKCPKCGEKLTMKVDLDTLDFQGGIASITVLHGNPQHTVVVYLDINGEVRGVEVPELTLIVDEARAEKVDLSEVVKVDPTTILAKFNEEILAKIILYVIAGMPVYFVVSDSDTEIENVLNSLAQFLNNNLKIEKNKIFQGRGFAIVDSRFYLINEQELLKGCVVYTATSKTKCVEPKSKFFKNFVRKFFKGKGDTHEAIVLIRYYDRLVNSAYNVLKERGGTMNYKALFKLVNIHSRDADIVLDALKARGLILEKNILKIP